MESDGFVIDRMVGRWNDEYGFLTFADDHGLYTDCEAYGNGDSGIYPGAASDINAQAGHDVTRYAIEIKRCRSHHNLLGYSGTAGDSVWAHDNVFTENTVGVATDSAFPNHPGLPQNHALFERNVIADNNVDYYRHVRDGTCRKPFAERGYEQGVVCPAVGVPVGTGVINPGGNYNIWRDNWVYGNNYAGFVTSWVPGFVRNDTRFGAQFDTSHHNRYYGNKMGVRQDSTRRPERHGLLVGRAGNRLVLAGSVARRRRTGGAAQVRGRHHARRAWHLPVRRRTRQGAQDVRLRRVRPAVAAHPLRLRLVRGARVRARRGQVRARGGDPARAGAPHHVVAAAARVGPRVRRSGAERWPVWSSACTARCGRPPCSRRRVSRCSAWGGFASAWHCAGEAEPGLGWLTVGLAGFAMLGALDRGVVMLPFIPVPPSLVRIVLEFVWVPWALIAAIRGQMLASVGTDRRRTGGLHRPPLGLTPSRSPSLRVDQGQTIRFGARFAR